ncbi:MSC_0882 family membrane protein [Mycoplasmopsis columboralis]|uniref:Uncharacterized protein n=1 Tax=Mycoplasmopsis columboralis TaxID=171282 RepID=A0A449B6P1_9BACT|nr:hypothetical protein [Mycoplasmopsis columboralis]VEU76273.1 Uncharacterised protein [Mycoplasmopsis columboralis]
MFKPKISNNTVELQQSNKLEHSIAQQEKIINKYQDPQRMLSSDTFRILKKEKNIRKVALIFWWILLIICLSGMIMNYSFNTAKEPSSGIYYWIGLGLLLAISLFYFAKNLIRLSAWKSIERKYRESFSSGDIAASTTFADLYKDISRKVINLTWIYTFFMTYFGLLELIVFGLYKAEKIIIKTSETSAIKIDSTIDLVKLLDNGFGNTQVFLIIGLLSMVVISVLYFGLYLYDKKRIQDIKMFIVNDTAEFLSMVEDSKKSLNKGWRNFYIVVFVLVVLLPIAIFVYLLWRGVLRFKKR